MMRQQISASEGIRREPVRADGGRLFTHFAPIENETTFKYASKAIVRQCACDINQWVQSALGSIGFSQFVSCSIKAPVA